MATITYKMPWCRILLLPGNGLSCAPQALARKQLLAIYASAHWFCTHTIDCLSIHIITFVCVYRIRNIIFLYSYSLKDLLLPRFELCHYICPPLPRYVAVWGCQRPSARGWTCWRTSPGSWAWTRGWRRGGPTACPRVSRSGQRWPYPALNKVGQLPWWWTQGIRTNMYRRLGKSSSLLIGGQGWMLHWEI